MTKKKGLLNVHKVKLTYYIFLGKWAKEPHVEEKKSEVAPFRQ
jgi:hypothetical protein